MLNKTTHQFAFHDIPLECDVYDADDYPNTRPVFLFFHSGGLVGGARICLPPWLAQVCFERQWPLISASYRLLPQSGGQGLLKDALAAHAFAQSWRAEDNGKKRSVIAGGASAGFFMANLLAHHAKTLPVALLGITGIPTFRHPFFNSSTLLTPEPIDDQDMAPYIDNPVEVGSTSQADKTVFFLDRILSSGRQNADFVQPVVKPVIPLPNSKWYRGCLYDYFLHRNKFLDLVGDVDAGFEWTKSNPDKLAAWPPTVFIQGDKDYDVSVDVTLYVVNCLGIEKATLWLANNQGHLFEATSFIEDQGQGMDAVQKAIASLDAFLSPEVARLDS
ncbi:hypothetical protein JX266_005841 [Neoarthrinium moseri]|nr:hypothetical protein JX266_005841 [Neoarthrinium moseri]